ncbi:MAG: Ig-like domain-containing protein [candidate division Zixibacteria bacterium]
MLKRGYISFSFLMLLVLVSFLLTSCGKEDEATNPIGDTTPPTIISTSPANNATNVPIDAEIHVIFSEAIDTSTISFSTINISPAINGTFGQNGDTITLTPAVQLSYSTQYSIAITTAVSDISGNKLVSNYIWSFQTETDPATLPPIVISTDPAGGETEVPVNAQISATFSKEIDITTLTPSSFTIDNGFGETISYSNKTATLSSRANKEYSQTYTATITTAVADTFGINLASDYIWSFTTEPNPLIPVVSIIWPFDETILGDTVTIQVAASHPVGVTKVEFYIDGAHIADDMSIPFEYFWDLSSFPIASEHTIVAWAHEATGLVGISDTVTVNYLWRELASDNNDFWRSDLRRVFARSTDTMLELRYECWESWFDPYDTIPDDTTLDLGIFFDVDQNAFTGDTDFTNIPLNDIGAEYRVIIGLHGNEALASWNPQSSTWNVIYDPTGFAYLNLPPDTNILEFGILWSDLGNPTAVNIVSINVFFRDFVPLYADWIPDQGSGFITIRKENQFVGEGYKAAILNHNRQRMIKPALPLNPFGNK